MLDTQRTAPGGAPSFDALPRTTTTMHTLIADVQAKCPHLSRAEIVDVLDVVLRAVPTRAPSSTQ